MATGTAVIHDTRTNMPRGDGTEDWAQKLDGGLFYDLYGYVGRVVVTTDHAASTHGLPVIVGRSGRAYGPADLPDWAEVDAISADDDPADPPPTFALATVLDDPFVDWAARRKQAHTALRNAVIAAGYRIRG